MSPSQSQFHAKREPEGGAYDQSPLKINKDSFFIKKPRLPPPTSPSATTITTASSTNGGTTTKQPPQPVIIYTHSPKVIHTHPRDFMALVQKLTGYSPPPEDAQPPSDRTDRRQPEDNESTSIVTEEHGSSVNDVPQVNSCFANKMAAVYDPKCYHNLPPFLAQNSTDFYDPSNHHPSFYNYPDSLILMPNMRNSFSSSSSSSLDGIKEFPDV